jgi:hypothetical protein
LWPATFAFGNALGFDALVVPRLGSEDFTTYNTEEQAADYPQGRYELGLQTAAEAGDQRSLDDLFGRRSSNDMLRLALVLVVLLSGVVVLSRWLIPDQAPPETTMKTVMEWSPEKRERAANAAAVAASHDPWAAMAWIRVSEYRRAERVATAAGMIACGDPWSLVAQHEAAKERYANVWKAAK